MKTLIIALTVLLGYLVNTPDAFARDNDKDKEREKRQRLAEKQARLEADRRANGYYDAPRYYAPYRNRTDDDMRWKDRREDWRRR